VKRGGPLLLALAVAAAGCRACFSLEEQAYLCDRDGGAEQCPGEWRCGLEGYCHAPEATEPFLCEGDGDCAPEWKCGQPSDAGIRRCHDRAVASALFCRAHEDCAAGWRCGASGRCFAPDAGTDAICVDDGQCADGWRCGPAEEGGNRCLDARAEALLPRQAGSFTGKRLNPALVPGVPDLVASSQRYLDQEIGDEFIRALAVVADGGLSLLTVSYRGFPRPEGGRASVALARAPLDQPARALAAIERNAYVLQSDGLYGFRDQRDGGLARTKLASVTGDKLRVFASLHQTVTPRNAIAVSSTQYAVVKLDGGGVTGPLSIPQADGGPSQIYDLYEAPETYPHPNLLVAATNEGVMIAINGGINDAGWVPSWLPVDFPGVPNARCPGDGGTEFGPTAGLRAVKLHPIGNGLALEAVPRNSVDDGGTRQLIMLSSGFNVNGPHGCPNPKASYPVYTPFAKTWGYWEIKLGPVAACAPGQKLIELEYPYAASGSNSNYGARTVLHCEAPGGDGAPVRETWELQTPYLYANPVARKRVTSYGSRPGGLAQSSWSGWVRYEDSYYEGYEEGRAWVGAHGELAVGPESLVNLIEAPTGLWGLGEALRATSFDALRYEPGVGLVREVDGARALGWIEGRPYWRVGEGEGGAGLYDGASGAFLAALPDKLSINGGGEGAAGPRVRGTAVSLPGGRELAVLGFEQYLASAEVTGWDQPGYERPTFTIQDVPRPGSPLLGVALAAGDPSAGGPVVSGFVLTPETAFQVRATSLATWRTTELTLPLGDPLALWQDGARARIGYRDGSVYTLPSRVRVAPPLGEPVFAFAVVCGQPFALSSSGLSRLELAPGAVEGSWKPEAAALLEELLPPHPDKGLKGGLLRAHLGELQLFTRYGGALVLNTTCAEESK
jgi:hypothetical protein